jgi:transcriptional regulator with XRE-family HTH domain
MSINIKKKRLQRAAGLVDRKELASRLGVSDLQLAAWLSGDLTMPDGKLLVLAAILDSKPRDQ